VRKPKDYALNNKLQELVCDAYIDSIIRMAEEMDEITQNEMRSHEVQRL
jgi:hypothetical protein